eukprot:2932643-Amphidinium_carterae.1
MRDLLGVEVNGEEKGSQCVCCSCIMNNLSCRERTLDVANFNMNDLVNCQGHHTSLPSHCRWCSDPAEEGMIKDAQQT